MARGTTRMSKPILLDAKIDRRRVLLLQECTTEGLDITLRIELHELDEDIKALKLAYFLTNKQI